MMTHEEACLKVQRAIRAETEVYETPPWMKKNEETDEETDDTVREGPAPHHGASPLPSSLTKEDTTMIQPITTTDAALMLAYFKAIEAWPDEQARILKGAKIAAIPFEIKEHGSYALVPSSKGDKQYTVNSHCDCPDPTPRCKHRFSVSLHRKAAQIHKGMLAPENQCCAMVGTESGIVHKVDAGFFFVPYGGPRGRFITSAEYVEGSQGIDWPAVQAEKERWEAAYYTEYGEIA